MKKQILFFTMVSSLLAAMSGFIGVTVFNIKSNEGSIAIAVYDSKKTFLDDKTVFKAARIESQVGTVSTHISVPPGEYTMAVLHDKNDNNKMDKKMGIPLEPYGVSNNGFSTLGIPKFDKARFDVESGKTTEVYIELR